MELQEFLWLYPRMMFVIFAIGSLAGITTWVYEKFIYKPSLKDELAKINIAYVNGKSIIKELDRLEKEILQEGENVIS